MEDFGIFSAPLEVFISLTHRCNLRCGHCSVSSSPSPWPGELSTTEWMDLIDEMEEMRVFTVRISGGEPFLHPHLFKLLERMIEGSMRVSINTNATLVGPGEARVLGEMAPWIDEVMVSLDGSKADIHERLRGEGSFRNTMEGIEALLAEGLPVSLYTTVVRYNWRDLYGIATLAKGMGVRGLKINELIPMGRALDLYRELSLRPEERRAVVESIRRLRGIYGPFITGTYVDLLEIMASVEAEDETDLSLNLCSAGTTEVAVRPDGWVVPCDRLYDYRVGYLRRERLRDIWHHSPPLNRFRERFRLTIEDLPGCKGCRYRYGCGGGCPAVPFNLGAGLMARDPLSCYRILKGEEAFILG